MLVIQPAPRKMWCGVLAALGLYATVQLAAAPVTVSFDTDIVVFKGWACISNSVALSANFALPLHDVAKLTNYGVSIDPMQR